MKMKPYIAVLALFISVVLTSCGGVEMRHDHRTDRRDDRQDHRVDRRDDRQGNRYDRRDDRHERVDARY